MDTRDAIVFKMADSLVTHSYKGTEYSVITNDPAQVQDLKCPVCLELIVDPVLTTCGHLFCQRCVTGLRTCPTCRVELQFMRDQFNERRVRGLKVKCPNWEKGCKWQGDLGDTAQHTGTTCRMETVPCPKGCTEKVIRGRLDQHGWVCPLRAYKCPHCKLQNTYLNITTVHSTICNEFPLSCPAGCRGRHSRSKMASHLAVCSEEIVSCKYASIGCREVIKRKDHQAHLDRRKDLHLERSMDMVMQLSMGLSELSASVRLVAAGAAKLDPGQVPLTFRPWLRSAPTCYPHPPCVIKVAGFQEKKEKSDRWFSDPVYSHFGGYKMCFRVDADGHKEGKGTHVSVFIFLMRGDNDCNLFWPFKGTIKVSLLNQLEDGQHFTKQLWSPSSDIAEAYRNRVTLRERAVEGWGQLRFIAHQDLHYDGERNQQLLKEDTLFFRVDCIEPSLD